MADTLPFRPRRPCPICSQPSQPKTHPFCSSRCAQIDLHRWFGEAYAVPAEEPPDEDAEEGLT